MVVEPYNSTLSNHHLIEDFDQSYCFVNEAVHVIYRKTLRLECSPSHKDLNHFISYIMKWRHGLFKISCPAQCPTFLRKVAVNVVPFPRLHFFVPRFAHPPPQFAPLASRLSMEYSSLSVPEMTQQMLDAKRT